jgi:hypothetical protein
MIFAIDDSEIQIEERPHTILAALGVHDPVAVESALDALKTQFGLLPTDEVKWNGMKRMPQQSRESLSQELITLLHESAPLVVINEGRNKQLAAERLATQIADFAGRPRSELAVEPMELIFDEGIIDDELGYSQNLRRLAPSPVASAFVRTVHSHESAAVQLADVLAGFNRLATEIALGRGNKNLLLREGELDIKIDLLTYISVSLRWAMWGEVPPPPDPENISFDANWPFKRIGGYGLRIHSRVSPTIVGKIYDSRVVYMGCLR